MLNGPSEIPGEQWRDLSSNRKYNSDFRDYETMLLNYLPGSKMRTNEAMHAVLESELEDETEPGKKFSMIVFLASAREVQILTSTRLSN